MLRVPTGLLVVVLLFARPAAGDDDPPALVGEVAARVDTSLVAIDVASATTRVLVAATDYDRPLVWRPDGAELLFWDHDAGAWEIHAVPATGGDVTVLAPVAWGGSRSAVWSPDGARLALWRTDPEGLVVRGNRGRGDVVHVASHVFRDASPVWRPDGKALAFEGAIPREDRLDFVLRVAVEDAEGAWSVRDVGGGRPLAWVEEGRTLLVVGGRADDTLAFGRVDVETGALRWVTPRGVEDRPVTWCAGRSRVVALRRDRGSEVLRVTSCTADGTDVRDHGEARDPRGDVVVHPAGWWIAWREGPDEAPRLAVVRWDGGDVVRHEIAIGRELAARP